MKLYFLRISYTKVQISNEKQMLSRILFPSFYKIGGNMVH